jgi:hypothetical protein
MQHKYFSNIVYSIIFVSTKADRRPSERILVGCRSALHRMHLRIASLLWPFLAGLALLPPVSVAASLLRYVH